MIIGAASRASGVSSKMIRYYESIGLVTPAQRSFNGYRTYSDTEVHTLRFIGKARDMGFSVRDIKELVTLWQDKSRASADVKRLALEHITGLEKRISDLQSMAQTLRRLSDHCHGDERPDCPILGNLASESPFAE